MRTHLTRIKSYKWDGDKVSAVSAFANDKGIKVDFTSSNLVLRMNNGKFIKIPKGLNVVAIANPAIMGYVYYRMSDAQLQQYLDLTNEGEHIVLD